MELTNDTFEALERYFSVLSHTGYQSYDKVDKLLVLSFLEELICGPMSEFLTEGAYDTISSCVSCLYGTCMIPYPTYKKGIYDKTVVPKCQLKNKS